MRLYARDDLGRRGVVFRTLEAGRLLPVIAARSGRLPTTGRARAWSGEWMPRASSSRSGAAGTGSAIRPRHPRASARRSGRRARRRASRSSSPARWGFHERHLGRRRGREHARRGRSSAPSCCSSTTSCSPHRASNSPAAHPTRCSPRRACAPRSAPAAIEAAGPAADQIGARIRVPHDLDRGAARLHAARLPVDRRSSRQDGVRALDAPPAAP